MEPVSQSGKPIRHPVVTIHDRVAFYSVRLARLGYYGGSPEAVRNAPLDVVLQMIAYEGFTADLQTAYRGLNDGAGQ